jgi:hypothetical protein
MWKQNHRCSAKLPMQRGTAVCSHAAAADKQTASTGTTSTVQFAFGITFLVIAGGGVVFANAYKKDPSASLGKIDFYYGGDCKGPVDYALFVGAAGSGLASLRLLWKSPEGLQVSQGPGHC